MMPRSLSTTKPVACEEPADSVSKPRTRFDLILTIPLITRCRVLSHIAASVRGAEDRDGMDCNGLSGVRSSSLSR